MRTIIAASSGQCGQCGQNCTLQRVTFKKINIGLCVCIAVICRKYGRSSDYLSSILKTALILNKIKMKKAIVFFSAMSLCSIWAMYNVDITVLVPMAFLISSLSMVAILFSLVEKKQRKPRFNLKKS